MFWQIFVLFAISSQTLAEINPDIDPWGTISYTITRNSKEMEVKCTFNTDVGLESIEWFIGDELKENPNEIETSESGKTFSQKINFVPQLRDNSKELICKFTGKNGETAQESVNLAIKMIKLPQELTFKAKIGENLQIPIEVEIYPDPDDSAVFWSVGDQMVPLGSNGDYQASNLMNLEDEKYKSTLTLSQLKAEDFDKIITFTVKADNEEQSSIIKLEQIEETKGLGAGLWVIIILVILIILACIGYCVWQKFFRQKPEPKKPEDTEKGEYNQVPTKPSKEEEK